MGLFRSQPQPKEDHPTVYEEQWKCGPFEFCERCKEVQAVGHKCDPVPPSGGSVITPPGGQSNRALIVLMKTIEREIERQSDPPQGGDPSIISVVYR